MNPNFPLENFYKGSSALMILVFLASLSLPRLKSTIAMARGSSHSKNHVFCARAIRLNEAALPSQNFLMEILG
jgi:hypothetical protein